ncbi:S-layer homology domain-containing protein [Paenibacillus sp. FSL R7-0198]|uniref:S-layer homology domain-containing protein n=1 Tax=Paenibacillus sp. FSL R7-0198 TaxID=2921674 RepID=UPI0030F7C9B1
MGKIRKSFSLLIVSLMLTQGAVASYVSAGPDPNNTNSSSNTSSNSNDSSNNSNTNNNNSSTSTTEQTPLEQLNGAISTRNPEGVLSVLNDTDLLTRSEQFRDLTGRDQMTVVATLIQVNPPSEQYNEVQVQFIVDASIKAIEAYREVDVRDMMPKLELFYNQIVQGNGLFSQEYFEKFKLSAQGYLIASDMDQYLMAYAAKLSTALAGDEVGVGYLLTVPAMFPSLNKAETANDMEQILDMFYSVQKQSQQYNASEPTIAVEKFPLQLEKLSDLLNDSEEESLAQWMLDQRPNGGYASFVAIQEAFDRFFNPNILTPLAEVNAARLGKDAEAMRQAIENPALGIHLPDEYAALTPEVKEYVAEFMFKNIKKDYEDEKQVQYMIELAIQIQSIWEEKDLSFLQFKLDAFAVKLVDGPRYFEDQETGLLRFIGQQHLERSKVNKPVFALKYMHLLAAGKSSGEFAGNIATPNFVLALLNTPFKPLEDAKTIEQMDQWLNETMLDQFNSKNFLSQYEYNLLGALDLSKREELSSEGKKELAEWLLNEEDQYENVHQLQYVFNRFFTAPNVKGNDITNAITGLDATMEISFNGGENWLDVALIQRLDFSGNKTVLVRHKAISDELPGRAVKIVFTQNGDSNTDNGNGSTPNPGGNTGGGSSTTTPVTSTPAPTTKQEQIVVDVNGANGTNLTKTPITRTTETNGIIKDLVKMTEAIAKESVEKAKLLNMNTARIVIPDTKDSVSETRIELPKAAVKELNDGSLKLEISTENAVISVPTNSIAGFDQDLYFRVVPLKKESERKEVEERAKKEQLIQQVAPNTNVRVLARPVEIDTNMQSREVTLTLPLRDSLPTDPAARQQVLDNLAIYIEHSDGTKELIQGKLVKLADNSEGIEFTVTKFSTFTLVVVDGLKASQGTHQPYIQGFGADFRPDAFVTRAQMAAMLARNLPTEASAGSTNSVSYKDVSATHWATSEIQKAQSAGIMNGMSNTQFAPEGSITRAQMATIAHRWMQQQASATTVNGPAVSFTDVSADQWAAEAIAYVQSAGLMVGYNDGTFKPDSKLTRAEAVKVLNVLFNRTPLTGAATPTFSDVTASHWAYADIEAAAQK